METRNIGFEREERKRRRREEKEKKVTRAGIEPTAAAPSQPTRLDVSRSDHSAAEAAEWSERLTSRRVGWLGAAAVGSIPALVTFFSFSSLLLLFLSSLLENLAESFKLSWWLYRG